jgi:hypothetical protein
MLEEKDFYDQEFKLEWRVDEHGRTVGGYGRFEHFVYIFRNAENGAWMIHWPDMQLGASLMTRFLDESMSINEVKAWCQGSWERHLEIMDKQLAEVSL